MGFNPGEARDDRGRWTSAGGVSVRVGRSLTNRKKFAVFVREKGTLDVHSEHTTRSGAQREAKRALRSRAKADAFFATHGSDRSMQQLTASVNRVRGHRVKAPGGGKLTNVSEAAFPKLGPKKGRILSAKAKALNSRLRTTLRRSARLA